MERTNPMHGHTQKIQIAIAKDALHRKNQQTMCIQDPTHIFSLLILTNYLVETQHMPGHNNSSCASLVKTFAFSHASNKTSRLFPERLAYMYGSVDTGASPLTFFFFCNLPSCRLRLRCFLFFSTFRLFGFDFLVDLFLLFGSFLLGFFIFGC